MHQSYLGSPQWDADCRLHALYTISNEICHPERLQERLALSAVSHAQSLNAPKTTSTSIVRSCQNFGEGQVMRPEHYLDNVFIHATFVSCMI